MKYTTILMILLLCLGCGSGVPQRAMEGYEEPAVVQLSPANGTTDTTKRGTVCYEVKRENSSSVRSGCQSKDWKNQELEELYDSRFVFPLDSVERRNLYLDKNWEGAIEVIYDLFFEAIKKPEGMTVRDVIKQYIVGEGLLNVLRHGQIGNLHLHYWVRFCPDMLADDCTQLDSGSLPPGYWEVNTATLEAAS